mmetsp:Transcript_25359/g.38757  ORF Transcript_25359/g.38757 Transcript_25359/m.38757 type:complete len:476 (+) Transcript_25359:397-1824(+)
MTEESSMLSQQETKLGLLEDLFSAGVQMNIFQFLSHQDLFHACQACKGIYQAINPFNFEKVKEHDLRYQSQYSSVQELPGIGFEGTMRVKKGTTTPVVSMAAESEDDELLIRMKLPHFKYPEHTHFYKLGIFEYDDDEGTYDSDENWAIACIEDEKGKSIVATGNIWDEYRSGLEFYTSQLLQDGNTYFLKIRITPLDWELFNDHRTLNFQVDALIYGIGLIQLHKEAYKYLKDGEIDWDIVEQVLHDGADSKDKKLEALLITAKSSQYGAPTLLHIASDENNVDAMKLFIRYCGEESVTVKDARGETPIFYAAQSGNDDVLKVMVEFGGKEAVMAEDESGCTAIHYAAAEGNVNALKIMLECGGEEAATKMNTRGITPLHIAAKNGHTEALIILTEAGGDASTTTQDGTGMTPPRVALSIDYVVRQRSKARKERERNYRKRVHELIEERKRESRDLIEEAFLRLRQQQNKMGPG